MKNKNIILVILLLSLVTIFFGISTAAFFYLGRGTTNNVIQTGRIVFSYSDAELGGSGNGIDIIDAIPIPDSKGKILSSPNEYFDFTISASTTSTDIIYEITANKQEHSDMDEDKVKIYLTEFNGSTELETPLTGGNITPTYAELTDTTNPLLEGKTIYFGNVAAGEVAYGKKFRLRMWLSNADVVSELPEERFSVKVNVAAVGNN